MGLNKNRNSAANVARQIMDNWGFNEQTPFKLTQMQHFLLNDQLIYNLNALFGWSVGRLKQKKLRLNIRPAFRYIAMEFSTLSILIGE